MSTIQVKDVPEDVAETLRRRALAAGQSLQAYMRQHLIEFARQRTKSEYIKIIEERRARTRWARLCASCSAAAGRTPRI